MLLHALLAEREQGIADDPIHPGPKAAVATKVAEPRDDADEDLLGGVLGVLRVPEEAQRHTVDVLLYDANHGLEGFAIALFGAGDF